VTFSTVSGLLGFPAYYAGTWYWPTNPSPGISSGNPFGSTTLAIANCQTDGFLAGDTVVSNPAGGGPATILSLDNSQVTVTSSTGWLGNSTQKLKRDPASYSAITGSPFTVSAAPLTSLDIPKPPLAGNTTYYARVRYTSTDPVTSDWSPWSGFTTGSLVPAIGALYGGGYFAGQINDGGTIYNLVVAPVLGDPTGPNPAGTLQGQYGGATPTGIQWKTSNSGDTNPPSQNLVYGKPATDTFGALGSPTYPMFAWCLGPSGPNAGATAGATGIGGYNDWYIPAKNELAVLYFFLKPGTTANDTASGSNANSVTPYTPNTVYGPGFPNQTTSTLFQTGGGQAFSTASGYWSATENSSNTNNAWGQFFGDGTQLGNIKANAYYARAIRRVPA
jgi:hypothetical protein